MFVLHIIREIKIKATRRYNFHLSDWQRSKSLMTRCEPPVHLTQIEMLSPEPFVKQEIGQYGKSDFQHQSIHQFIAYMN